MFCIDLQEGTETAMYEEEEEEEGEEQYDSFANVIPYNIINFLSQ